MNEQINNLTFDKNCVGRIPDFLALYDNIVDREGKSSVYPMNEYTKTSDLIFTFIKKGEVVMDIDGKSYNFHEGDSVTIIKNIAYKVRLLSADYQYFAIEIDNSVLTDAKNTLDLYMPLFQLEKQAYITNHLDAQQIDYLESLYKNLFFWLDKNEYKYYKHIIKHIVNIFVIYTANLAAEKEKKSVSSETAVSRQRVIFEHFIKALEENADKHRDVKFYASYLNVTPKYLSAITVIYTGKSAISCIEEFVINKIKGLMDEQRYSIREICNLMNFKSQSFFGRYFKRYTGVSPKEFIMKRKLTSY